MTTWGIRGTMAAIGVAAMVAGLGGAAVYAATAEGPGAGVMHGPPQHRPPIVAKSPSGHGVTPAERTPPAG
jgi:hypothetical protein